MENPNYEQVVKEAAKGMDTVKPGWYREIDRERLSISDCTRCVFAQIFGDYMDGILVFRRGLLLSEGEYYSRLAGAFVGRGRTSFWLREIDARLEADKSRPRESDNSADAFIARTNEIINQPLQEA